MATLRTDPSADTARGFSFIELTIVMGIMLVLSSIAVVNVKAVVSNARLRAGVFSLSNLLRSSRMIAVTRNRTETTHFTTDRSLGAYVKASDSSAPRLKTDPQMRWSGSVITMTTPGGLGAPDELSSVALGFLPETGESSFNARGMPCTYSAGNCPNKGFIYYFKDTSRAANKGWAALSISPAGRIKQWFWNGGVWTM
jgi:prepilin-type N-terminal cleavage/methylation domain-containing protein